MLSRNQLLIGGVVVLIVVLAAVWMSNNGGNKKAADVIKNLEPVSPKNPATKLISETGGYDPNLRQFFASLASQLSGNEPCEQICAVWYKTKERFPLRDNSYDRLEADMFGRECNSTGSLEGDLCRGVRQILAAWKRGVPCHM